MPSTCENAVFIAGNVTAVFRVWEPILMLILLAGSAFFSGAETAFFNLSPRQLATLRKSRNKLQALVANLLTKPRRLLSCLLFGNMTVNVLFFAISSVLTLRIREQIGLSAAAATALLTLAILVLFGEILPKSFAYASSKNVSLTAAVPAFLCLQVLRPVLLILRLFVVEPAVRLILGPARAAKPVTAAEFRSLIDHVQKRGLISADENKLIAEIIQLGYLKVRDCLRPRVDMPACSVTNSIQKARQITQDNHLTKLPVYAGKIDNIVGLVHLRDLLLQPQSSLDKLVQPVHFVPEQKTVESLLELFRTTGTDTALVVDEYGGIAGSICLEDIAEELIGPIELGDRIKPIERIGTFEYRLAGNLAVHDWADLFGVELTESRYSTIAGLVTALLGRIPKTGDVARLKNLKLTVESVQRRRIETVLLTLEQLEADGQ
ncbi:MAG: hemolysin family protein [Planctomycetota bacterium]